MIGLVSVPVWSVSLTIFLSKPLFAFLGVKFHESSIKHLIIPKALERHGKKIIAPKSFPDHGHNNFHPKQKSRVAPFLALEITQPFAALEIVSNLVPILVRN